MPELPEVETVRRSLAPRLIGRRITGAHRSDKPLRQKLTSTELQHLVGAKVDAVERRAKYLVIKVSNGWSVLAHLGMSGQMLVVPKSAEVKKHTHVVLALDDKRELRFVDPRRFGQFSIVRTDKLDARKELAGLGPDPFSKEFTIEFLRAALHKRKAPMKSVVLDQKVFAGMGNIYVAEALFTAGISPRRAAARLTAKQIAALHAASIDVLQQGIDNRGTSFSDYVDADGDFGSNEQHLFVYGREDEPCRRCKTPIKRLVQSGRSTFFCPKCQR